MFFFHFQKRRNKDEERSSSEPELNLYKDYTKVKPLASSSEEDNKVSQSLPDSSEDEEVFRKEQVKPTSAAHVNSKKMHKYILKQQSHIWNFLMVYYLLVLENVKIAKNVGLCLS